MTALALGLFLLPLADQGLKRWVRGALRGGSVPLGRLGRLQVVEGRTWLSHVFWPGPGVAVTWGLWLTAATVLSVVTIQFGAGAAFAGLLLGGSLSHLLESSLRGSISDYVCLRFWPAFDLADAAIVAGAIGLLVVATRAAVPSL